MKAENQQQWQNLQGSHDPQARQDLRQENRGQRQEMHQGNRQEIRQFHQENRQERRTSR